MVQTPIAYKAQKKKKSSTKRKAKAAEGKLSRGEVKSRWDKEVMRTKWEYDKRYKHPARTETIARKDAMELPTESGLHKLKKEELDTLPYEERFANIGAVMKLHDRADVVALIAKRKEWQDPTVPASRLGIPQAAEDNAQAGPSSSGTQEPVPSAPQDSIPPD